MAVKEQTGFDFKGRHFAIGTNVVVSVVLAFAIVVILQWGAFYVDGKLDLTRSGLNSLSPGAERLIADLQEPIRLTSLYFQTDIEDESQAKYRKRMDDLLALLQSSNRSRVEIESLNPLQDHGKRERLAERLRGLKAFSDESAAYMEIINRFRDDLLDRMATLIQTETDESTRLQDVVTSEDEKGDLGQIQSLFSQWQRRLASERREFDDAMAGPAPQLGVARIIVGRMCSEFASDLNNIATFALQIQARRPELSEEYKGFVLSAEGRYQTLLKDLEGMSTDCRELEKLRYEEILTEIGPTSNALLIETADDASVVTFSDIWPPIDPSMPAGAAKFKDRMFRGEEKVISTILRLTQKERTAVVFIRFGGGPLFYGGMPGMPPPAYAQIREVLEDANFDVSEWDVATSNTPPTLDPAPTKTIYIVLRPLPPQGMPRQSQQQEFNAMHAQMVEAALGVNPRAIFMAGWAPGPFGPFPDPYRYDTYLTQKWGIHVNSDMLLLEAMVSGGEFHLLSQSLTLRDFKRGDHVLVNGLKGRPLMLPRCDAIELAADAPEGVRHHKLLWKDRSETLWGVKNVQPYLDKARLGESVVKEKSDTYGPFTLAVAAEKGEGKIIVIGSSDCLSDRAAMAAGFVQTAQGLAIRQLNPGNLHLLLNSLHWLNDHSEWMDVGKPVDIGVIEIDKDSSEMTFIKTFVYGLWPGLALLCGGVAWRVRRS